MKTNDLQAALSAFLNNNPDLPEGETVEEVKEKPAKKIALHVSIEKKGRNGKTATIIDGLSAMEEDEVDELARELKKKLGVGGSFRRDEILIQGECRDKVVKFLQDKGFRVK